VNASRYNRVWKISKQGIIDYILNQSRLA